MAPPDLQLLNAAFAPEKYPPPPGEERSGDGDRRFLALQELLEGVASSSQPFSFASYSTSLSTMSRFEPSSSSHES
eukprot:COSAG04_NODE_244_length_18980_cov_6.382501_5_plen_76_part_00